MAAEKSLLERIKELGEKYVTGEVSESDYDNAIRDLLKLPRASAETHTPPSKADDAPKE